MKSAVESLGPTRVRLTVEVPFAEMRPSVDAAYRKLAGQVRVPGFRPGRVPPRLLDQRVGRDTVLQEAVQDAVPRWYAAAVRESGVSALGQPEVQVTEFADGGQLVFTAEVDVRPEIQLPDYRGLPVTVDDAEVADAEVDDTLTALRERFATLTAVDGPAANGSYVSVDLSGSVDGEPVDDLTAAGLSYEVGSGGLLPGLDEALVGLSAGESRSLETVPDDGPRAGQRIQVQVTVRAVRTKELPELDDEFASTASEFDTLAELRSDVRSRLARVKQLQQRVQARDRVAAAVAGLVDVPLPERLVEDEVTYRRRALEEQLRQSQLSLPRYAAIEGKTEAELQQELADGAATALRTELVLDEIARREQLQVTQEELTEQVLLRARQLDLPPDEYAQRVVQSGHLSGLAAEALRSKALALVLQHARVRDASGRPIDLAAQPDEPERADTGAPGPDRPGGGSAAEGPPVGEPDGPEPGGSAAGDASDAPKA